MAQALLLGTLAASGQTAGDAQGVPTLRVSTSLIEIPLLIRDKRGELPTPSLPAGSIQIKLGNGDWLRPNFVRQEGQDPIDLAVLLDLNSPVSDLTRSLTQALSSFKSLSLTPKDHVSLFVMDCASVRIANIPADPSQVAAAIKNAIEPPGQSGKQTCKEGGRVWDTLAAMSRVLRTAPSRRAVLAIPEGLADLAQDSAVAIFHLDPTQNSTFNPQVSLVNHGLPLIAQSSGGLMLGVEPGSLRQQVQSVVTMLRGRYIVQLRVPADAKPGHLQLSARVTELTSQIFTVRITGNSAPLPNAAEASAIPSQVAKTDATPKTDPVQPAVAAAEVAAAPAVWAAAVVDQGQPTQQPATPSAPQTSDGAASTQANEQWAAHADAAMQAPSLRTDSSVPTLKVSTRLTLVDVTVTDSKGHPVHGLTQSDFTVKEDGKPQSIKNFETFGSENPSKKTSVPQLPPDVYSNATASRPNTQAVNVLLFDQVSTGISYGLLPEQRILKDAKEASAQYLKTMPAGMRVAVLQVDGSGLHMVQGFTSDRDLLLTAVNSVTYQASPESYWYPPPPPPPVFAWLCAAMNFQSAQALNALNQTARQARLRDSKKSLASLA
jgi:hypothetical protein